MRYIDNPSIGIVAYSTTLLKYQFSFRNKMLKGPHIQLSATLTLDTHTEYVQKKFKYI